MFIYLIKIIQTRFSKDTSKKEEENCVRQGKEKIFILILIKDHSNFSKRLFKRNFLEILKIKIVFDERKNFDKLANRGKLVLTKSVGEKSFKQNFFFWI